MKSLTLVLTLSGAQQIVSFTVCAKKIIIIIIIINIIIIFSCNNHKVLPLRSVSLLRFSEVPWNWIFVIVVTRDTCRGLRGLHLVLPVFLGRAVHGCGRCLPQPLPDHTL